MTLEEEKRVADLYYRLCPYLGFNPELQKVEFRLSKNDWYLQPVSFKQFEKYYIEIQEEYRKRKV